MVERAHQVVHNMIRTQRIKDSRDLADGTFDGILSAIGFAMRSTVHTTTRATPSQLVFGRDSILNVNFEADWQYIKERKQKLIQQNNKRENSKRIPHTYSVGDKVMVLQKNSRKHGHDEYRGPYEIERVNDNGTVKLKQDVHDDGAVYQTWNIRNLKPHKDWSPLWHRILAQRTDVHQAYTIAIAGSRPSFSSNLALFHIAFSLPWSWGRMQYTRLLFVIQSVIQCPHGIGIYYRFTWQRHQMLTSYPKCDTHHKARPCFCSLKYNTAIQDVWTELRTFIVWHPRDVTQDIHTHFVQACRGAGLVWRAVQSTRCSRYPLRDVHLGGDGTLKSIFHF